MSMCLLDYMTFSYRLWFYLLPSLMPTNILIYLDLQSAVYLLESLHFYFILFFMWHREAGIIVKNVDVTFGEVNLNLNEELFSKSKKGTDTTFPSDKTVESTAESLPTVKPQKKQALASLSKYTSVFPEKVVFRLVVMHSYLVQIDKYFNIWAAFSLMALF